MILVFGKSGQIASHLAKYNKVICLSRNECDGLIRGQATDFIKKLDPELIINAAAYTDVTNSENNIDAAFELNARFPEEIAKASHKNKIPIIQLSTDYVYGNTNEASITESHPCLPLNEYGKSKLEGEKSIKEISSRYLILRTSWIFSEYSQNFVKKILKQVNTNAQTIEVVSDQIGCPSSAKSVADTVFQLGIKLREMQKYGEVYNYCGLPATSWSGFAEEIVSRISRNIRVKKIKTNHKLIPKRQNCSILNCQKIKKDFNISQHNWHEELDYIMKKFND